MGHTHSLMDEVGEMRMVPEVPNSPPEPNSLPTPRPALLPKAVNSSATAAIPSICQEKETIASCRCPDGHAIVPNALVQASVVKQDGHVVQRQYPAVRNYGECDICEARGTTHRCVQNCDYDLCERCFDQSSVEAARSQSQPPVEGEDSGQGDKNQSTADEKEQGPQVCPTTASNGPIYRLPAGATALGAYRQMLLQAVHHLEERRQAAA